MDKIIKIYYPGLQNLDNIIEHKTYVLFASNKKNCILDLGFID